MKHDTVQDLERRILVLENELEKYRNSLNESEEKYRMFFSNLTEAISLHKMITDEEGNIVDFTYEEVNPAREKLININYSELKDLTVKQVNPDVEDSFIKEFGTSAITGKPLNFEFYSRIFDKWLKVKVFSPKYGYVATIIEDFSEQKKAEEMLGKAMEKYKTIFENSIEGIILIDNSGTITEWNKFIENKTGLSKMAVTGRKLWEVQYSIMTDEWKIIYPVDDLQKIWLKLIQTLPEEEIRIKEGQYLDKDGKLVLTEDLICPLSLNGEKYLCIIQRDLTDRRNAEQELKINEQMLKQLNATKDKLFSIIAHDLRSPFNSILGYSSHLRENIRKYPVEESEKYLDIINSSAQNTLNLLINLLNWARIQTGQYSFNPRSLHLQSIINEVVEMLDSSARMKNISINHSFSNNITIHADEYMLKTILQNLISNAVKFTNPGGTIDILAFPDEDQIEINIADNGRGISREAIENLFEIATNSPAKGTLNETGSGLGLVICRELVEKHRGKIWVESEVGKGSNFKISLPAGPHV